MSQTARILISLAAVASVAGGAVWWLRPAKPVDSRPAGNAAAAPAHPALPPSTPAAASQPAARLDTALIRSRWPNWLHTPPRDPFRLLLPRTSQQAVPDSPISRFQLQATWLQTGSRLAVIDRRVYAEGEMLAEYRIVSIKADAVLVQGRENREEITFTSYVPGGPGNAPRRTNVIETWLGPERERVY